MAASSRIFVKGLPPTFGEAEFKKHFSQGGRDVTDAKIFPNRRIGYVGYKTPEDAQKAVKYFNKTFIRMSRIGVEVARPIDESKNVRGSAAAPTTRRETAANAVPLADNRLKRKRDEEEKEKERDPKLNEFLESYKLKNKKAAWENDVAQPQSNVVAQQEGEEIVLVPAGESDDEYEQVPTKVKASKAAKDVSAMEEPLHESQGSVGGHERDDEIANETTAGQLSQPVVSKSSVSDSDWARSRTSRLLGLLDDDEEEAASAKPRRASHTESEADETETRGVPEVVLEEKAPVSSVPTPPVEDGMSEEPVDQDLETVRTTMRLFVRNLPFDVQRDDLEAEFSPFGSLEEVHIPLDKKTGSAKGFAYVQFTTAESAERALIDRDGQIFQGRLMHVLPGSLRKDTKLDDFALSKLPLKKQQEIKKRREAASTTFNWNALYMNTDAVVSSVAQRLGLSKSEVLDPTSSDAAIKQAHAETHVIQETKSYFRQHGVDLDSFKKSQRGDTAILVKNIPFDCSRDDLKRLFEEQGDLKKFLMPASGIIAIVEFANAAQAKSAFGALAYRKVKSSVLFLERAPKDVFSGKVVAEVSQQSPDGVNKISTSDLRDADQVVADIAGTATLFVRNLNFSTTSQVLGALFGPTSGFMSARVKTRTDPKKPGQILSMGFGFLEYRTSKDAQAALQTMDGYTLDGHKLQIRASHKGADAAEERKKADAEKRAASAKTKIIIKNLPFEASKKDVRALFGAYGQLRSVRVPQKMDRAARGFGFADFTTVKEARNAMEALRDTHLLGRRLVLDYAAEDPEDAEAEIEKMQQKVGTQVNKVALQKLTSGGRKKFTTQDDDETS